METPNEIGSASETVTLIKAVSADTVHKICSGQVILNLAVAVKELVENSLDAKATSIDVRLKNYGLDLIEVTDNGCGVAEANFQALTLKHHTSKLTDYSDLLSVTSFGFRGEALSSLCALADLSVITRHSTSEYATKIDYDHKGAIAKKTLCSRQIGTTVILSNLFSSLPVRQKEFQKNAKREFNKMTQLLYAYCLISTGVKITCTNQTNLNNKSVVVTTQGSSSYKDNIACVFGPKQLNSLLEINPEYTPNIKDNIFKGLSGEVIESDEKEQIDEVDIDLSEDSNDVDDSIPESQQNVSSQKSSSHKNLVCPVNFTGYISTCAHGSGRSSADRQFYYVNSRPCEPTKISKLINEIYRQYNSHQYPFVFLNINIDNNSVDVNVTPDKRKLFLTKEKIVLDVLKCSLQKLFENIPRTLKLESLIEKKSSNESKADLDQPRIFKSFLEKFSSKTSKNEPSKDKTITPGPSNYDKRKSSTMLDYISPKTMKISEDSDSLRSVEVESKTTDSSSDQSDIETDVTPNDSQNNNEKLKTEAILDVKVMFLESTDNLPNTQIRSMDEIIEKSHTIKCHNKQLNKSPIRKQSPCHTKQIDSAKPKNIITDVENLGKHNRKCVSLKTSLDHVTTLFELHNTQLQKEQKPDKLKFRSGINPVFNKKCEEELTREISKSCFQEMIIIGQFNLGFIITQLNDDLFIIDQHATDEIYNFEMLQRNTELTTQKLVIPQKLELTGVNEQILIDNLDIFRKNGFTFDINENALPTKRVKLVSLPMSKNWLFGKEDIEELLFMLRESPSEYCRPSRVRAMFASRACRKSVMIGTALGHADMKKLVDHMADIDKPWNCPHGRPTIRHLVNLAMVHTKPDSD